MSSRGGGDGGPYHQWIIGHWMERCGWHGIITEIDGIIVEGLLRKSDELT